MSKEGTTTSSVMTSSVEEATKKKEEILRVPVDLKQYHETNSHQALLKEVSNLQEVHMRRILSDERRTDAFIFTAQLGDPTTKEEISRSELTLDITRQLLEVTTLKSLLDLAEEMKLKEKIAGLFGGKKMNKSEGREVLHTALRAPKNTKLEILNSNGDLHDVMPEIHEVRERTMRFADSVRNGTFLGYSGKPLKNVICIGIGGSYLGPEFLYEALRMDAEAHEAAKDRTLRFLANVDPVDIGVATEGLDPEATLVIVISKTFTTQETMLNARYVKGWILRTFCGEAAAIGKHMVAVSSNIEGCLQFGIEAENIFGFWDFVGGRFSSSSSVGLLPLALQYGPPIVNDFLDGLHAVDKHFEETPVEKNLPVIMGLVSLWNITYLRHNAVAILPYTQALSRFPAHIQQLLMESNGKHVDIEGRNLHEGPVGELYFGEPGTNGQHSFYQLLHQGITVPAEFIGYIRPQYSIFTEGEPVSQHDELMSNFFAQPDALAIGKQLHEVRAEGVPKHLAKFKTFSGNRPSQVLLFPILDAFNLGCLLALYEHRTAVEGFVWGINSFDQMGVELGKILAKGVREYFITARAGDRRAAAANMMSRAPSSTIKNLNRYVSETQPRMTVQGLIDR